MKESVIDFPKESLCPEIWEKVLDSEGMNEVWQLKPSVRQAILDLYDNVCNHLGMTFDKVHITGSITSNSYTENADIDVHFLVSDQKDAEEEYSEELNKKIREFYKDKIFIGKHPIELYFQGHAFQDFMSIGCYDVLQSRWEVGPELLDTSFDPYSEYYEDVQKLSNSLAQSIRSLILAVYEKAVVCKKLSEKDTLQPIWQRTIAELQEKLKESGEMFDRIREMRKVYSSPISKEDALEKRSSRKWKIADAAFKLFDKYGYLAILKQFKTFSELLSNSSADELGRETAESILSTVKKNIASKEKLSEKEDLAGQIGEGMLSNMTLAALLAIPGLVSAESLAKEMSKLPQQELRLNSTGMKTALDKAAVEKKSFNGLSYVNLANLIATIAYNETMVDFVRYKDPNIIYAICQLISNRAGGDPNNFAREISRKSQFYSFKHVKNGIVKDDGYQLYDPHQEGHLGKLQEEAWLLCKEAAVLAIKGELPNVIGDRNMLANKKIDNAKAYSSWGKDCDLKIGSQTYGYQKDQDGYLKYKTAKSTELSHSSATTAVATASKIYAVQKGDSLWKIAKSAGTTVEKLLQLNSQLKGNPNKLQIGQKLRIA